VGSLLEPEFLAWLERLRVLAGRTPTSSGPGENRSPARGRSAEFSEHRDYRPGDDFRHIDWRAWGRLDRLFLKVFVEERDRTLSILLDSSASMGAGGPGAPEEGAKFDQARRLAAALAWVGLGDLNRVGLGLVRDHLVQWHSPVRGRPHALELFRLLESARPEGRTDLTTAFRQYAARSKSPGRVVVISDFLQPGAGIEALRLLRYRGEELLVVQVLHPTELAPQAVGDLRLVDVETGSAREVTLDARLLEAYRKSLQNLCDELSAWCHTQRCSRILVRSDADLQPALLQLLRRGGLVR
jgi:uncharacterized protein (DUF58 family)